MSPHKAANSRRYSQCEILEERLALTVQAIADFSDLIQLSTNETSQFSSVLEFSNDLDELRSSYSFDGSGQTVAVIDSGIAWDHYALGGGFGEDFRVVGGWDFAENDSNPFDDGPAGFHGTHVAGIVGSQDSVHGGVAAGVDLVGLRVFDDFGRGNLEWVEQALQWVHDHRHDYEHPITTVNLSLGLNWNSANIPNWATLEDEFSQLKADGIFISVAAGNRFQSFLSEGLSYPAASQHVVPVGSHGSDGDLSDFSQRDERILIAPGESVQSTVPAQLFGQKGPSNRFMASSGTSMAAPYVAGASVLLREAMELAGSSSVDQKILYDHFRQTADDVYDSVTKSWYSRLNLTRAIDQALQDQHGESIESASKLGKLSELESIDGILARTGEIDFASFVADQSGRVTLSMSESNDLKAIYDLVDEHLFIDGDEVSFEVEAGRRYTLQIAAEMGQGRYEVAFRFEPSTPEPSTPGPSTPEPVDFGLVQSKLLKNQTIRDGLTYQVIASKNGFLTVETTNQSSLENLDFEIYDSSGNRLVSSVSTESGDRAEVYAIKHEQYTVKFLGNHQSVDVRLTNMVRVVDSRIIVVGTAGNDVLGYASGDVHHITANGTTYEFSKSAFTRIRINGGAGNDDLKMVGTSHSETLSGGNGRVAFRGNGTEVIGRNLESVEVDGNGGMDTAILKDSTGSDRFTGSLHLSEMVGDGFRISLNEFTRVNAIAGRGGNDFAELHATDGVDVLRISENGTSLSSQGFRRYVKGFEAVNVIGHSANDREIVRNFNLPELVTSSFGKSSEAAESEKDRFSDRHSAKISTSPVADRVVMRGLSSEDSMAQLDGSLTGVVFGSQFRIWNFRDVDWSAELGEKPEVSLIAVEKVYQCYADPDA